MKRKYDGVAGQWRAAGVVFFLTVLAAGSVCARADLPVGTSLAAFSLDMPDAAATEYLGLQEGKTFTLREIQARLVLVEFYSMYCPVCQRQAPRANQIFGFIQEDPALNKAIKVIGIAVGNFQKEVDIYRKTFRVQFPLFPDPEKTIAKKTGIENIPLTVLLDRHGKVVLSHVGVVENIDKFMKEIRTALGNQP